MTDDIAQRFFDYEMAQQTAAYVGRGRSLELHSDQDVLDIWTSAFESWYRSRSTESRMAHDDVDAECRLRGLEAPHDRVRGLLAALRRETDRIEAVLGGAPPPPALVERFKAFMMTSRFQA
jgi:hypothetical protein